MYYIDQYLIQDNYHIRPNSFSYSDGDIKIISDSAHLYIGKFCSFAKGITIFLGENHHTDWVTTYPFHVIGEGWTEVPEIAPVQPTKGDVRIGNDVWIGTEATIMSGVTIGDGAIIGAKAVVAKDIPPYAIAVGNSARIVRYRFDNETIDRLLELAWWNWPKEKIDANINLLCSDKVEELLCTTRTKL